jgi:NADH-quinone oxidoreductase subunit N
MSAAIALLMPEIAIVAVATMLYLGGAFFPSAKRIWRWAALAAIAVAAAMLWRQHGTTADGGPIRLDELAWCGRWLALGFGLLLTLLLTEPPSPSSAAEYAGSLLLTVAGLMLVFDAANLVLLFVSLELISIPTYIMLNLGRRDASCRESAAKYFFLSVLSSAVLLYGLSFLYGAAGTTDLAGIRTVLEIQGVSAGGVAAMVWPALALVFAGLCFRIAAVPFHFYAPDVYQGTTHPNAAMLSVVPKAAGLAALTRILAATPGIESAAWPVVLAVSVLTMTVGNVMALRQKDLRRLLAYSSIAQAGYMLLALAVALASHDNATAWDGLGAMAFYLATYSAATIGLFAVAEHRSHCLCQTAARSDDQCGPSTTERRLDGVGELAGLGRSRPLTAAMTAACLLSLTGIPPLAGFWGKLLVFGAALNVDASGIAAGNLRGWFIAAAVAGALNAAVSAAYYLRIAAVMYFGRATGRPITNANRPGVCSACWWAALLCALLVVGIGIYPSPLTQATQGIGPLMRPAAAKPQAVLDQPSHGNHQELKKPPPQPAPQTGVAATTIVPAPP